MSGDDLETARCGRRICQLDQFFILEVKYFLEVGKNGVFMRRN
jgi:hypothetical protein